MATTKSTRPKPTDATGRARAAEIKKNSDELERRAEELSTIAATEAKRMQTEVHDPKTPDAPVIVDEVVNVGAELGDDSVVVRLIADIDTMTWGYGNDYSFTAGVKYKVPRDLAVHLETLGYLYTA